MKNGVVFLARIQPKIPKKFKQDPLKYEINSEKVPNQSQDLSQDQAAVTLSTIHLLKSLFNKIFGLARLT